MALDGHGGEAVTNAALTTGREINVVEDMWEQLCLFHNVRWETVEGEYDDGPDREPTETLAEAEVVASQIKGGLWHYVLLDLDVPAFLVPSSTPGNSHLYIGKKVTWEQYKDLLGVLADAGIVEPGYVEVSLKRGHCDLRLPWIKKPEPILPPPPLFTDEEFQEEPF